MPEVVNLGHATGLPPRQVIRYFKSKGYDISWDWWEVWQEAHAKAFTVAKATRLDVLQTLRGEVENIFTEGITGAEFRKRLEPRLRKMGWWGKGVDEAGNAVQLGSPYRLKTIYRTNMRTGYAHGHYRAHIANVDSRPYWQYDARNDQRTRPEHAQLDGRVFRYDDPFWKTHYPPNGWNCRCLVNVLTAKEVEESGLKVSSSKGRLRKVVQEVGVNKRTGEIVTTQGTAYSYRVKDGKRHTLLPDAGWSYNPGEAEGLWDIGSGGAPVAGQKTFKDFGLPPLAKTSDGLRLRAPATLPKSENQTAALAQLLTALAIPKRGWREVQTPDGLDNVIIRKEWLDDEGRPHNLEHIVEAGKGNRERFANYILPTLKNPLEVWLTEQERYTKSGKKQRVFRRRFIALFKGKKARQGLAVVQENKDGSILWTFVPSTLGNKYLDNQRQGLLLYRKREG